MANREFVLTTPISKCSRCAFYHKFGQPHKSLKEHLPWGYSLNHFCVHHCNDSHNFTFTKFAITWPFALDRWKRYWNTTSTRNSLMMRINRQNSLRHRFICCKIFFYIMFCINLINSVRSKLRCWSTTKNYLPFHCCCILD